MITALETPCIEADAVDVIEVMRSPEPVLLAGGEATFSVHGYLAVVKKDGRQSVYPALHVRELQRSFIYAVDSATATEAAREQGQEFLGAIGFRLEPVSLKFSPAMREVILREIPVLLSAEAARRAWQEKEERSAEWRRLLEEPAPAPLEDGPELSLAEWTQRKRQQDALVAARKAAVEHLAAEERIGSKAALLREIVERYRRPLDRGASGATEGADRERLQAMLAAAQASLAEMKEKVARLTEEVRTGKAERDLLAQARTVAGALLTECRQQLAQAEQARKREAEERRVSELARQDAEKRLRALYETAQKMKEQLTLARAERMRLMQEKEAAERLAADLREAATQAAAAANTAVPECVAAGEQEASRRLAAVEEELRQARTAIDAGEAERVRLAQALAAAEQRPAAAAAERAGRIEQLESELRVAKEGEGFLRRELERLAAQKVTAEARLAEMERSLRAPATVPLAKAVASNCESRPAEPPPHVVRRPPPADAFFHVDWDLAGVPYGSAEEIGEIRQTMNRVRLSLEGYPDQYCSAGLVVTRTGEHKNVFVALRLSTSNRVLVYVPASPPATPAAFTKALKEAEKFLQVVGFDLEIVPLSKNLRQRAKTLESINFLIPPPKNAGNF